LCCRYPGHINDHIGKLFRRRSAFGFVRCRFIGCIGGAEAEVSDPSSEVDVQPVKRPTHKTSASSIVRMVLIFNMIPFIAQLNLCFYQWTEKTDCAYPEFSCPELYLIISRKNFEQDINFLYFFSISCMIACWVSENDN
jgi:hypothetical protein